MVEDFARVGGDCVFRGAFATLFLMEVGCGGELALRGRIWRKRGFAAWLTRELLSVLGTWYDSGRAGEESRGAVWRGGTGVRACEGGE